MTGRGRPEHVISDEEKHKISAARALCERRLRYAHFFLVSTTLPAMMSRSRSLPAKISAS